MEGKLTNSESMTNNNMGYELLYADGVRITFIQYGMYITYRMNTGEINISHKSYRTSSYTRCGECWASVNIEDRISESEYLIRKQLWELYNGEEL